MSPEDQVAAIETAAARHRAESGIVWRQWGEGPPLLLLHGAHGGWFHWIRVIPQLSRTRRLLIPDLPGHGDSTQAPSTAFAQIAALVAADLPAQAGGEPIDVVGFSFGGMIAAQLAADHPHQVRRLIIAGAGGLGTPYRLPQIQRLAGLDNAARAAAMRDNLAAIMFSDDAHIDALAEHLQKRARYNGVPIFADMLPDRLLVVLGRVRAAPHFIWSEFDRVHPDPAAQIAAARTVHSAAELRVVSGAGHWMMYEQPERFLDALDSLLDAPAAAGSDQVSVMRQASS